MAVVVAKIDAAANNVDELHPKARLLPPARARVPGSTRPSNGYLKAYPMVLTRAARHAARGSSVAQVTEDLKGFPTVFWFPPDKSAAPEVGRCLPCRAALAPRSRASCAVQHKPRNIRPRNVRRAASVGCLIARAGRPLPDSGEPR